MQPLIERDIYGNRPPGRSRPRTSGGRTYRAAQRLITLEFDQPVVWSDSLGGQFYLDGAAGAVVIGLGLRKCGHAQVEIALDGERAITYLKETNWIQDKLLIGVNGIAALTFCNVPIDTTAKR